MDKLRALETFVAIVDRGSLTRAAEALETSLPAVVRQLAALEADVGVRLLNRTTRRLSLTEDGRQYLTRVRHLLADLDDAEQALGEGRGEPRGTLRVTAPVLFGTLFVAPLVQSFLARHREVRVELLLLDRVVDLVDEGIDVGVRIADLPDSTLVSLPVAKMRHVVVASPGFLKRVGLPRHPLDLARHNCVRFGAISKWSFLEGGRPLQVAVAGDFTCNLTMPVVAACVAGRGFGMFLSYQVAAELRAKALRVVLSQYELPERNVSLVYPSARLLPSRTRAFVDWMRQGLKERARELVPSRA
ncbi:MAG: LysR family transcriptional regulator [Myxococcales bacterium]|nr:LysR family transcriptional regulator [Myxococcales bacterium]